MRTERDGGQVKYRWWDDRPVQAPRTDTPRNVPDGRSAGGVAFLTVVAVLLVLVAIAGWAQAHGVIVIW